MSSTNDALRDALANWDSVYEFKARFIEKNRDPEGGDPLCGYQEWDEYMMDINYDLAEAGEVLADALKAHLEGK
jgi:hypothetical protein